MPPYAASRAEKDKFFDSLQQALDEIPSTDCYVLLGDFNSCVGSGGSVAAEWEHARGPHGHGKVNEAGKELLTFLSLNKVTVCNTWFTKKDIYTNKHGSTRDQRNGTASPMPSPDKQTAKDTWMHQ